MKHMRILHSSSAFSGSVCSPCASLAGERWAAFIGQKGRIKYFCLQNLTYRLQYLGSLKPGKCAVVCSHVSSKQTGDAPWHLLMDWVLADARVGGTVVSRSRVTATMWKPRGAVLIYGNAGMTGLSLSRQGGKETSICWAGTRDPSGSSSIGSKAAGHCFSCQRLENTLEAYTGLVEIPGEKTAAGENRACYWHERHNWMASGGHGQELHGRRNPLSHPYGGEWNRQDITYMYVLEHLRAFLYKTQSNQKETAQCCHWRR